MTNLLLVEDDATLGQSLSERLNKEGYSVLWRKTLRDALQAYSQAKIDVAILDVGLPDGDGFSLAREIRSRESLPIIFLTAMNSAEYRLEGYEMGADDYIPKPFHLRELLLRLKRVLDKHGHLKSLQCGNFRMLPDQLALEFETGQATLTPSEYQLLELLVLEAPRVLRREKALELIWHKTQAANQRTLDNAILRLRGIFKDSLPENANTELIGTIRGVGYQWLGATPVVG